MEYTYIGYTVMCLLLLCYTNNAQQITMGPSNTAARIGETVSMACRVDQNGRQEIIAWAFIGNGTTDEDRVYYYNPSNQDEFVTYPELYTVDPEDRDNGIFDLTVREVSTATAGRFKCSLITTNPVVQMDANLVSVSPIKCSPEAGDLEVIVGVEVSLVCEASYTGYKPPSFTWQTDSADFPGEWEWNYEKSVLTSNVSSEPIYDDVTFTCDLAFHGDSSDNGDPPTHNDTCSTHFYVMHGATSVTITPEPEPGSVVTVYVGDHINCTASGRPEPIFMWEDITEGEITDIFDGPSLLVTPEWAEMTKTFSCVAMNTINDVPREARLNISVQIIDENPAPPVTTGGGVETWVIVVAVVVPVVVLAGAGGGAASYLYYRKRTDKKRGASKTNPRPPDGGGPRGYGQFSDPDPGYQGIRPGGPRDFRGPPPGGAKPAPAPRVAYNANGKAPPTMAGMPVMTNTDNPQQNLSGGDSPGYGDLGIKHLGTRDGGIDASQISLDPDPRFYHGDGSSVSLAGQDQQKPQSRTARASRGSQGSILQPQQQPQPAQRADRSARGSQGSILDGPQRGNRLSQGSMQQQQPAQRTERSARGSQGSVLDGPPAPQRGNRLSQGSMQQPPQQQKDVFYHNVPPVPSARGNMGSQASLSQPIPRYASQASINNQYGGSQVLNLQPSRGYMGSKGSLASQGSRGHGGQQFQVPYDVPDTTV